MRRVIHLFTVAHVVCTWLGICGIYGKPSIMDEGAPVKKDPYKIYCAHFLCRIWSLDSVVLFVA